MSGFKRRTPPCFMPMTLKECFGSGAPYEKMRLDCRELREEILKSLLSGILKSDDLQLQKPRRVRAAAAHPPPASYCLAAADDSFLTSDPGIEGDAHTAVGVVGLHGNFPCATRPVAEREGGRDVGCTLRPNVRPPCRPGSHPGHAWPDNYPECTLT